MIDYQVIVDDIRNSLMFSETAAPETLRHLSSQYKDACEMINDRLRACSHALRQGNVPEAVRLAEMEPNLLDVYTILDFPEREEWVEVVATLGFAVPPPLSISYARELNDAYDSQNALEPYLKRYRLAALGRSPLAERISLLREIVRAEPQNIVWLRDQESLEKVRITELDAEVRAAIKNNNLSALNALQEELSQNWVVPPPQHLREQVELILRSNRLQLVEKEMREYAEKLIQTHLEFDYGKSLLLYEKIMHLQNQYRFSVPEDIVKMTRGAVAWLQEENRQKKNRLAYRNSHDQMLKSLNDGTRLDELLRLSHQLEIAATNAETTIPEETTRAIENEIDMRELRRRRKSRLLTIVVTSVCLLVLGMTSLFVYSYAKHRKIQETIVTLERLKTEASPTAIRNYLNEKEGDVNEAASKNEQIAALLASLRAVLADDERRVERFEEKSRQLTDMLEQTQSNASHQTITRQEGLLNDLEQLAQSTEERHIVETLRRDHLQLQRDLIGSVDREILAQMQAVQNEITTLNNNRDIASSEKLDRYRELLIKLERADADMTNASPRNRDRCRNMINSLQEQINAIDSGLAMQERMASLQRLIGRVESFRNRLEEIAAEYPDKDAAKQLLTVVDEFDGAVLLVECGQLSTKLTHFYFESDQAPEEAKVIAKNGDMILSHFVDATQLSIDTERLDAVRAVANRPLPNEPRADLLSNTRKLLDAWQQKPVWPLFESPDETWYYVTSKPERKGFFEYRTKAGGPTQRKMFGETFFRETTGTAQVEFAKHVSTLIEQLTQQNWTGSCTNLIVQLQKSDAIDPILKYQLLTTMIRDFSGSDAVIQKFYGRIPVLLNDRELENYTDWQNFESPRTAEMRKKANESLAKIEWPKPADVAAYYKSLIDQERPAMRPLLWVGFLNRDADGWKCEFSENVPPEPGELMIVRRTENVSSPEKSGFAQYTLERIGRIDTDRKPVLFDRSPMLQGAPVFLKTELSDGK